MLVDRSGGPVLVPPPVTRPALIASRFEPRRLPDLVVGHPRRLRLLEAAQLYPVTIVQAPPGYGKSTLAAIWHEAVLARDDLSAWLSLEPDAADPEPMTEYLSAAIDRLLPDRWSARETHRTLDDQLKAIGTRETSAFLILEDVDRCTDSEALTMIDTVLRYAPPALHVIMTARGMPLVDVERLERHCRILQLKSAGLALTDEEAWQLQAVRFKGAGQRALHRKLGGWVSGIQLGAQHAHEAELLRTIESRILGGLDPGERALLTPLAFIEGPADPVQFSAMAQGSDPAALAVVLGSVADRGLFVERSLDVAHRFEILPPLRYALLSALKQEDVVRWRELHLQAATLSEAEGDFAAAITHWCDAGNADTALILARAQGMSLLTDGRALPLLDIVARLGPTPAAGDESLRLAIAWASTLAHCPVDFPELPNAEKAALAMFAQAMRADDPASALSCGDAVLADPQGLSPIARMLLRSMMARGAVAKGELARAHHLIQFMTAECGSDDRLAYAKRNALLAACYRTQGQPREAERILRTTYAVIATEPEARCTASALVAAHLAYALYERDALSEASTLVDPRWPVVLRSWSQDAYIAAHTVRVRTAAQHGDCDTASMLIEQSETLAVERGWVRLQATCIVERARLGLPSTVAADALVAPDGEEEAIRDPGSVSARVFAILAELRIYQAMNAGDRPRLNSVADRLMRLATASSNAELEIKAALYSILPQLSGRCDRMVDLTALKILNRAAQHGFRRMITDILKVNGVRISAAFESASYAPTSFVALLSRVRPPNSDVTVTRCEPARSCDALSFLTAREIDVLTALAVGVSNKEMARQLHLTPETVKWHLKNIMRKLGAETRAEAVVNAETLGLRLVAEAHAAQGQSTGASAFNN